MQEKGDSHVYQPWKSEVKVSVSTFDKSILSKKIPEVEGGGRPGALACKVESTGALSFSLDEEVGVRLAVAPSRATSFPFGGGVGAGMGLVAGGVDSLFGSLQEMVEKHHSKKKRLNKE